MPGSGCWQEHQHVGYFHRSVLGLCVGAAHAAVERTYKPDDPKSYQGSWQGTYSNNQTFELAISEASGLRASPTGRANASPMQGDANRIEGWGPERENAPSLEIRDLMRGREQAAVRRPQFAALVAVTLVEDFGVGDRKHANDILTRQICRAV
jgi:hypothetical protein